MSVTSKAATNNYVSYLLYFMKFHIVVQNQPNHEKHLTRHAKGPSNTICLLLGDVILKIHSSNSHYLTNQGNFLSLQVSHSHILIMNRTYMFLSNDSISLYKTSEVLK